MRAESVLAGLAALFLVAPNGAWGQTPAQELLATLKFEVATVKPAAPLTGRGIPRGGPGSADPGRINFTYASMKNLLMTAYAMKINQITGPAWIDTERYDIVATVPPGATKEQVNVMLQNLLADRFKLVVHRETRDLPLYELVVAKNGSKMKPYVEDPKAPKPEPGQPFARGKDGNPIPPPGTLMMSQSPGRMRATASKQSMSRLTDLLAGRVERPVIDKTGLAGDFDYSLEFRPEGPNALPPGPQGAPDASDAPDIFTAVQEQLGLKLESKKGPIEMLVVDRAEKVPAEN
jgi:uncharacterized protein (TIGR03435 family)